MEKSRVEAQQEADRIRVLRESLASGEVAAVLALTEDQQQRFSAWADTHLANLAKQFDVDTTASQKRMSWGMRIASTLAGLALCAAVVLFFRRYWGYLDTPAQIGILAATPLAALAGAEFAARRERTLYFAGLLSLVSLASFMMNLVMVGDIFNMVRTDRAMLAWGLFSLALAYRYGLRLMLAAGLVLLTTYAAAELLAQSGYGWGQWNARPELLALLGVAVFLSQLQWVHRRNADFPSVYRLIGVVTTFLALLALASWGGFSYLPWKKDTIEKLYEGVGLALAGNAIWWGIRRNWVGVVNTSSAFFAIFLFQRLYRWWWDWMPRYLFFAVIGTIGIVLVLVFRRLRVRAV